MADTTVRLAASIRAGFRHALDVGGEVVALDTDYAALTEASRPTNADPRGAQVLVPLLQRTTTGKTVTLFAQDTWRPVGRLVVAPGVRLTHYDLAGRTYVDPRVSASYPVAPRVDVHATWSIDHQIASNITREDREHGDGDFWVLADGSAVPVARTRAGGRRPQRRGARRALRCAPLLQTIRRRHDVRVAAVARGRARPGHDGVVCRLRHVNGPRAAVRSALEPQRAPRDLHAGPRRVHVSGSRSGGVSGVQRPAASPAHRRLAAAPRVVVGRRRVGRRRGTSDHAAPAGAAGLVSSRRAGLPGGVRSEELGSRAAVSPARSVESDRPPLRRRDVHGRAPPSSMSTTATTFCSTTTRRSGRRRA